VWYPGEAGGHAVAEVLFGDYSPAGRLPITFPVSVGQLPLVYNHKPTGRGDDYMHHTGQAAIPLWVWPELHPVPVQRHPSWHRHHRPGDTTFVSVRVTNTGKRAGDEVVQLYLRDELASVALPVMELHGFQRVHLLPGETKEVRFEIQPEMLSMLDIHLQKVIEPGDFRIMIGASSKDIRQRAVLRVK
jgi:beta-glucosidase